MWVENRSKQLHDTLAMKDKIVVKPTTKVGETPKKGGRKAASVISWPTLPKGMNYVIKKIPAHPLRFEVVFNFYFANEIKKFIKDEGIEMFKNTIFGPYLNIPKCNFQGQITKCLLLMQASCNKNVIAWTAGYMSTFAEFLSDQLVIPFDIDGYLSSYLHYRYAALLWRYDSNKVKGGYISENDDPPKSKGQFTTPTEEDFVNID
ncbi:hypothetical protein RDI58_028833 [Solanum bulbocastanum]|uniref:Uncharacterized protein n=1 Tax=Solanum bulbocastanum TaxID=147425 RepID=A0AAN8SSP4_SOLBU